MPVPADATPSAASRYLLAVARHLVDAHRHGGAPRAALVSGSTAEGNADEFSDLDLSFYYDDHVPTEAALAAVRDQVGADHFRPMAAHTTTQAVEAFRWHGVECQVI